MTLKRWNIKPADECEIPLPPKWKYEKQLEKIKVAIKEKPLTYNELLDAVPEFKNNKRPLNSLRPVVIKGMERGILEYTQDTPLKIKLKNHIYT